MATGSGAQNDYAPPEEGATGGNLNVQNIAIKDIHPYAKNPRKNDEAVKAVAASIREFGCAQRG